MSHALLSRRVTTKVGAECRIARFIRPFRSLCFRQGHTVLESQSDGPFIPPFFTRLLYCMRCGRHSGREALPVDESHPRVSFSVKRVCFEDHGNPGPDLQELGPGRREDHPGGRSAAQEDDQGSQRKGNMKFTPCVNLNPRNDYVSGVKSIINKHIADEATRYLPRSREKVPF